MRVFRWLWTVSGLCVALYYLYFGIMFAGAWIGLADPPQPPMPTSALAFMGGALLMAELAFPALTKARI